MTWAERRARELCIGAPGSQNYSLAVLCFRAAVEEARKRVMIGVCGYCGHSGCDERRRAAALIYAMLSEEEPDE